MANERRVRFDFVAGVLSVGMAAGDTVMQSNGLQDLPALAADEYCPLGLFQVDLGGRVTKKEIVFVSGHSAGAGSATVIRGRLGTTAQSWAVGDRWSHTDFGDDNIVICTSTIRPTQPYEGQQIYERDTKLSRKWDGTNWVGVDQVRVRSASSLIGAGANLTSPVFMQMGSVVVATNASGDFTITYPTPFPNGVLMFLCQQGDNTHAGATYVPYIGGQALAYSTVRLFNSAGGVWANSGSMRVSWLAIGW